MSEKQKGFIIQNENFINFIQSVKNKRGFKNAPIGQQFESSLEMQGIKYKVIVEKGDGAMLVNILNKKGEVLI
jgi:hypothetical protein